MWLFSVWFPLLQTIPMSVPNIVEITYGKYDTIVQEICRKKSNQNVRV